MDEHDVPYFRDTLTKETNRLTAVCKSWQDISTSSEIPEEIAGDIRTAIGLTALLMDQRFKQFSGLVDDCEFQRGEKKTTCEDLQGFWDMVYVEVEKVDKKFNDLEELKANSWVVKPVQEIPVVPKKKPLKPKPALVPLHTKAASSAKAYILAARKRLAEAKSNSVPQATLSTDIEEIKENINVEKPLAEQKSPTKLPKSKDTPAKLQSRKNSPAKLQNSSSSPKKLQKGKVKSGGSKEKSTPVVAKGRLSSKVPKEFIPLQCVTRAAAKRALMSRNQSI